MKFFEDKDSPSFRLSLIHLVAAVCCGLSIEMVPWIKDNVVPCFVTV